MPLEKKTSQYKVECEHIVIMKDGSIMDDLFTCSHNGKGFLYAKRGTVEYFEIPSSEEKQEIVVEGEVVVAE